MAGPFMSASRPMTRAREGRRRRPLARRRLPANVLGEFLAASGSAHAGFAAYARAAARRLDKPPLPPDRGGVCVCGPEPDPMARRCPEAPHMDPKIAIEIPWSVPVRRDDVP